MKSANNILSYEVIPSVGIGDIKLGMHVSEILSKYATSAAYYQENCVTVAAYFPNMYVFSFFNSVELFIDITTSKLVEIRLKNNFLGKYMGEVGVGDAVSALRKLSDDISFDDEDVIIGKDWGLIMVTNEDLMSLSDSEIDSCLIETMIIKHFPVLPSTRG